jgi:thiol-disulfide isomerase/thioredoxin
MKALNIALTLAVLAGPALRAQDTGIKVGAEAPAAAVEMLDGRKVDLATMYGEKPVVLEFWATWCPLCRKLEPSMEAARAKHGSMVSFVSVGVPSSQTPERQKEYAEKQKLGGSFVFDRDGAAMKAFSVPHTSYIVVIDKHRKVVYTGVGAEQDIEAALKKVLP